MGKLPPPIRNVDKVDSRIKRRFGKKLNSFILDIQLYFNVKQN